MVVNSLFLLSLEITRTSSRPIRFFKYSTVSRDSEKTTNFCSGFLEALKSSWSSKSLNLANLESSASVTLSHFLQRSSKTIWSASSISLKPGLKSATQNFAFFGLFSAFWFIFSSISSLLNPWSYILLMSKSGAINTRSLLNMSIMFWFACLKLATEILKAWKLLSRRFTRPFLRMPAKLRLMTSALS